MQGESVIMCGIKKYSSTKINLSFWCISYKNIIKLETQNQSKQTSKETNKKITPRDWWI